MSERFHDATALVPRAILVTGGLGFIGSHLVELLSRQYPHAIVHVLDLQTYAASTESLRRLELLPNVRVQFGDIRVGRDIELATAGCDLVYHLAAETHVVRSFSQVDHFNDVNVRGTRSVLESAAYSGVQRVVHVSTDEVYGATDEAVDETAPFRPTTPYAWSKAMAEQEVARIVGCGLDVRVVRPTNAVGPRQHREKLLPRFVDLAQRGQALTIEGTGRQERTFLPVCDLARAIDLVGREGQQQGVYNVAGLERMTVLDVAEIVRRKITNCGGLAFVDDRPVNDACYRVDDGRLRELGYAQRSSLVEQLDRMVQPYANRRKSVTAPSLATPLTEIATT